MCLCRMQTMELLPRVRAPDRSHQEGQQCRVPRLSGVLVMSSRTVSQIFGLCGMFARPLASHMHENNAIHQHVGEPAEEYTGASVLGGVPFKLCPPELWRLMVMAWKTLRRQVLPMDTPPPARWTHKGSLHPESFRKCLNPKAAIVCGTPLGRRNKVLVTIRCLIKSVDLNLHPVM